MASFHVQSKVCIAPIHVQSKWADFAPHMDVSNADFAPHMEGSYSDFAPYSGDIVSGTKKKLKLPTLPIFLKNLWKLTMFREFLSAI